MFCWKSQAEKPEKRNQIKQYGLFTVQSVYRVHHGKLDQNKKKISFQGNQKLLLIKDCRKSDESRKVRSIANNDINILFDMIQPS